MLVPSRRSNETVVVHQNITVTLSSIQGDSVCLDIESPDTLAIQPDKINAGRTEEKPGALKQEFFNRN